MADMRDEPEIKPVPEPTPVPVAPEPAPSPVPSVAAPTPPPARKAAKKVVVDASALDEQPAPVAITADPVPQAPQADPEAEYVRGLTDEQKDRLLEAEVAARLYPEKYGQQRGKLLAWYRSLDSTITTLTAADPSRTLDENDEDFKRFLATKPKLEPVARDRVQRAIGADEAERKVMERMNPKLEELETKQRAIEFRPKIAALAAQTEAGVMQMIAADDKSVMATAVKALRENGDAAAADHPLEAEIIKTESQKLTTLVTEYAQIAKGITRFDQANPWHAGLLKFINDEGDSFALRGGNARARDGKSFLPRAQFVALSRNNPAEAAKHWTFDHNDVVRMLAFQAKASMEYRLKAEEELAAKRGFTRKAKSDSKTTPKVEPQPLNPPAATPTPARGAAAATPAQVPASNEIDVVETLGFKKF